MYTFLLPSVWGLETRHQPFKWRESQKGDYRQDYGSQSEKGMKKNLKNTRGFNERSRDTWARSNGWNRIEWRDRAIHRQLLYSLVFSFSFSYRESQHEKKKRNTRLSSRHRHLPFWQYKETPRSATSLYSYTPLHLSLLLSFPFFIYLNIWISGSIGK